MKLIALSFVVAVITSAAAQNNVAEPLTTPTATASSTTPATTATPIATPIATPVATATPAATVKASPTVPSPPTILIPSLPSSPPPVIPSPPPPPGAGSQKTAVLSVVELTGSGLQLFNSTLGDKFIAAMTQVLDISSSSIVIRNWGSSSGRRLLSDTVTVGSAALFSNGVSAASGLAALNTAANSGALQAAFQTAGLPVESLALQSAVTALPSNFQPLYSSNHSRGLQTWAIVVIAVVGLLVLLTFVLCCCRQCFCCCRQRDEDGEEKLPRMIKFGSMGDQTTRKFCNAQKFTLTAGQKGRPLPEVQMNVAPGQIPETI